MTSNSSHLNDRVAQFVSGMCGGVISSSLMIPFDVTRNRLAIQVVHDKNKKYAGLTDIVQKIYREEGWRGFYRGVQPTVIGVPFFWAIYFPMYNSMKDSLSRAFPANNHQHAQLHKAGQHMLSALVAGGVSDVITNPIWLIRTRMQTEFVVVGHTAPRYKNLFHALNMVRKEEGIKAWWRGLGASLLGLSHSIVQFPIYEYVRATSPLLRGQQEPQTIDFLAASAISKVCASTLTYPHEVLRARLQHSTQYKNLWDCIRRSIAHEGYRSLYQGLSIALLRTVPMSMIMFSVYEKTFAFTRQQLAKRDAARLHAEKSKAKLKDR
eukprot:TRINITY_DN10353_c0_g1_i1.p1 TRINITY_DN10353_c0_g1~~TRINITY_DN10353_c0_g1_i1.p1  ORF type:complete len:323 (+),score=24.03 TRINITY_DN10353_c0_g1_i1:136-1104(+)